MSLEDQLEIAEDRIEEANRLLSKGRMHARAASSVRDIREYSGGFFIKAFENTYEEADEYAETAIDALKDAYFEAYVAHEVTEDLEREDMDRTQDPLQILQETLLPTASGDSKVDVYRFRNKSERIMESLETRYGDALDFQGYVNKILDAEEL